MRKSLTVKQRSFVKEYVRNGGNGTQAALSSYDTKDYDTANQIAVENLQKPTVVESINEVLNNQGLDLESIASPVKNILYAQPSKVDAQAILRAAELLYKLHGAFPATKRANLNINLTETYQSYSYKELLQELAKQRQRTEELLTDLKE